MVQGRIYELGLRITNIAKNPSAQFIIKNFITEQKTDNIAQNTHNEFTVKSLNPMESTEIWVNVYTVKGEMEVQQQKTNTLILWLTIITVFESLFGLKKTAIEILSGIAFIFSTISHTINTLIS